MNSNITSLSGPGVATLAPDKTVGAAAPIGGTNYNHVFTATNQFAPPLVLRTKLPIKEARMDLAASSQKGDPSEPEGVGQDRTSPRFVQKKQQQHQGQGRDPNKNQVVPYKARESLLKIFNRDVPANASSPDRQKPTQLMGQSKVDFDARMLELDRLCSQNPTPDEKHAAILLGMGMVLTTFDEVAKGPYSSRLLPNVLQQINRQLGRVGLTFPTRPDELAALMSKARPQRSAAGGAPDAHPDIGLLAYVVAKPSTRSPVVLGQGLLPANPNDDPRFFEEGRARVALFSSSAT